jgi:translation initiation factor 2 beta subunit (eIF-2beta)/eIF-5
MSFNSKVLMLILIQALFKSMTDSVHSAINTIITVKFSNHKIENLMRLHSNRYSTLKEEMRVTAEHIVLNRRINII